MPHLDPEKSKKQTKLAALQHSLLAAKRHCIDISYADNCEHSHKTKLGSF